MHTHPAITMMDANTAWCPACGEDLAHREPGEDRLAFVIRAGEDSGWDELPCGAPENAPWVWFHKYE